jgi:hypothetical protein
MVRERFCAEVGHIPKWRWGTSYTPSVALSSHITNDLKMADLSKGAPDRKTKHSTRKGHPRCHHGHPQWWQQQRSWSANANSKSTIADTLHRHHIEPPGDWGHPAPRNNLAKISNLGCMFAVAPPEKNTTTVVTHTQQSRYRSP